MNLVSRVVIGNSYLLLLYNDVKLTLFRNLSEYNKLCKFLCSWPIMVFVEVPNYEIHVGASLRLTVQISNNKTLIACILIFSSTYDTFTVWLTTPVEMGCSFKGYKLIQGQPRETVVTAGARALELMYEARKAGTFNHK